MRSFLRFWSAIFLFFCIIFGIIFVASKHLEFSTDVILDEVSVQFDEEVKEEIKNNFNELKKLKYTFIHKGSIQFKNPIFKAHRMFTEIMIQDLDLKQPLSQSKIIFQNSTLILSSPVLIEDKYLGKITYKVHFDYYWLFILLFVYLVGILLFKFIKEFIKIFHLPRQILLPQGYIILNSSDRFFIIFVIILCIAMCLFTFYLGFPGYHIIGDTYSSIGLDKTNAHPVFIAYILELLYECFGKHLYYLFLFNIIPFYVGICFLVCGFYIRFRSKLSLLLIFPTFIGNIYFQNFVQYNNFSLSMLLFCLYSVVLFSLLTQKRLYYFIFVIAFFALLWRHNAIFSVYPVCFVLIYLYLCKRDLKINEFLKYYFILLIFCAILSLSIVLIIPKWLISPAFFQSHTANHIFLHQIAGSCVNNDDEMCFKKEWYEAHKNFDDVKKLYAKYPLDADPFNVFWAYDDERPFKHKRLDDLQFKWAESILKYPKDFFAHEIRFFKAMWFQSPLQQPSWIFDSKALQNHAHHPTHLLILSHFQHNERSITLNQIRKKIYDFIFEHKIIFNHIVGVLLGGILMFISAILLCVKSGDGYFYLIFVFSASFASFWSAVFIAGFTPVADTRYMSPILPLSIVALVGFMAFIKQRNL